MPILVWKSDRFDGLSSDDDVQVLYSGIVLTKFTFNFYCNTFYVWTQTLMSFGTKSLYLLCSFVVVVVVCLFVLFCFLLLMHKRFTQNFRFVFNKVELQAGSVRKEQNSEMDAQKT